MNNPENIYSPNWLQQLQWVLFGGSLIAAVVAFVVEGHEYLIGSLLLAFCTLVIGAWCLTRKPPLIWMVGIVCLAMVSLGWTTGDPESALFQLIIVSAIVGWRMERLRTSLLLLVLLAITPPVGSLGAPEDSSWGWWNWSMGVLIIWSFGRVIHILEQTLHQLTEARSQLIHSAAREERLRISRDVHDMVGHSLTAILLNIRAAQRALASERSDPDEAERALIDAEQIGVAGIADVRAMWIGLQQDPIVQTNTDTAQEMSTEDALLSLPDGQAVMKLLSVQEQISVCHNGDVAALKGPSALALYRVLQECITNILKHAVDKSAAIQLDVNQERILLQSSNPLAGEPSGTVPFSEQTIGLISMRERVTSLGGTFVAGEEDGRWQVRCKIPRHD